MGKLFEVAQKVIDDKGHYTAKVQVPQYLPSNEKPFISQLYDADKYSKLMRDIKLSSVSEEEKSFLRLAASRHIIFNYSKIADYYAHASAEMQELMEQSALIILDIDDAIANGYVKLSSTLDNILRGGNGEG